MLLLNHRLFTTLFMSLVLCVCVHVGAHAAAGGSGDGGGADCIWCETHADCDVANDWTCNSATGCCEYNPVGNPGCSCPSSYPSGYCSGTSSSPNYSNCYKSCTRVCTQTGCPSGYSCTYNSSSTSGKQYYNSSTCDAASSNCSIKTQTCNTNCTSVSNSSSTSSGTESCSYDCTSSIANAASATYLGSRSYTNTCNGKYTGGGCSSAGATCTGCSSWTRTSTGSCGSGSCTLNSCKSGYYKSGNACYCTTSCTSVANSTSTTSGTEGCSYDCTSSIANAASATYSGTRSYTNTCNGYYTSSGCSSAGASCSGCSSWSRTSTGTCGSGSCTLNSCNSGYYKSGNACYCTTSCTSVANRVSTTSGSESCTRSCSISNGTCSYSGSTRTYTNTCNGNYTGGGCSSAGASCSGCSSWTRTSTGTCSGGTISITCNAGYYLLNGTCVQCESGFYCTGNNTRTSCPSGYGSSAAGSDAASDCYTSCTKACTQQSCPSNATCTHGSTSTTGTQYYGGSCSASASTCSITVTCNAGFYKNSSGTCTQCESGYYCPGNNSRYNCPDPYTYAPTSLPANYFSSTVESAGISSGSGLSSADQCYALFWFTNARGGFYEYIYYNSSASRYVANSPQGWHRVNPGYYLTNRAGCGYYAYYYNAEVCPAGYYCPGKSGVVCDGSNQSTVHTTNFGLNSCPSGYQSGGTGLTTQNSCIGAFTKTGSQLDPAMQTGCSTRTLTACTPGTCTYYKNYAGTITSDCTPSNCTKGQTCTSAAANYYLASGSPYTCSSYSSTYTLSDGGSIGSGSCYVVRTNTGTEVAPSLPTGCAAQTVNSCTKPTCTYKDYAGQSGETCSPGTCNQTHKACTSASTNYYLASGVAKTCSSYSSSYPSSAGGNITSDSCYGSFSKSGSQLACSQPANSASYTCGSCTVGTCNYTKYASGTIKTDCTPTNCTKPVASVSCKANYYASGVTCPACPTSYPYSDAGTTSDSYCYASKTSTGSQLACSTPSGCASSTCGTCTPGTCDWRDYKSATDTSCTPTNCTKPVASVTANANRYVSGTTCPACDSSYPYSDGGSISSAYCYSLETSTGSQLACSKPANSATYACGTCTPGTCDWRDYKSATDTSCTPDDCTKPVSSVSCNTGYYKDGVMCPACTNKPDNSYYTGTASSNACPWECDDGYSVTDTGTCESFCTSGITHIHLSTGLKIPLYRSARTSPAINVLWNDTICYGSLAVGAGSGLNIKYNGTVYHAIE